MERMTGLDACFLYMETPTVTMHTTNVLLVDVSRMRGGYSFARVRRQFERRVHLVPLLRRRVIEVPYDLDHPVWFEDPEFDLDHHLRRVVLPPPGDRRALESQIGELMSAPLERDRPLWSITVVEGLHDGRVALVCKVHHAMIDGAAIASVLTQVMSDDPEAHHVPAPGEAWSSEPVPTPGELVRDAVRDRLRRLTRLPGLVARTALAGARLLRRVRAGALELSLPFTGPATSLNLELTARRSFAMVELPLAELRSVKEALGCTLNDVVLGVAAGALRRFLARSGEHPRRPLLAGVPVATGGPDDARLGGNKVSNLLVSLRTDLADPRLRLQAIHGLTIAAKHAHDLEIGGLLEDWAEYARPWLVRLVFSRALRALPRPPINLVISNLRGPVHPQFLAGAELVGIYLGGPLLERVGLNLTVWTYRDTVYLAAVTCPDVLPDLRGLLDECELTLADLAAVAGGPAAVIPIDRAATQRRQAGAPG